MIIALLPVKANSNDFTSPGVKKPLSFAFIESNLPVPSPNNNNPFPASLRGVSISDTNKFPAISASRNPSRLKSSTIISLIFGSWICWDLKAIQIDLTADEYIIAAVDVYLDILNMFLWALICCLHCFETILKG